MYHERKPDSGWDYCHYTENACRIKIGGFIDIDPACPLPDAEEKEEKGEQYKCPRCGSYLEDAPGLCYLCKCDDFMAGKCDSLVLRYRQKPTHPSPEVEKGDGE